MSDVTEEPPVGSVVMDCDGDVWGRTESGWTRLGSGCLNHWEHVRCFAPLTLLQPVPEPPADEQPTGIIETSYLGGGEWQVRYRVGGGETLRHERPSDERYSHRISLSTTDTSSWTSAPPVDPDTDPLAELRRDVAVLQRHIDSLRDRVRALEQAADAPTEPTLCPTCDGAGALFGGDLDSVACDDCDGTGQADAPTEPCGNWSDSLDECRAVECDCGTVDPRPAAEIMAEILADAPTERGICGASIKGLPADAVRLTCSLPAGHEGWHRTADGCDFHAPPAPTEATEPSTEGPWRRLQGIANEIGAVAEEIGSLAYTASVNDALKSLAIALGIDSTVDPHRVVEAIAEKVAAVLNAAGPSPEVLRVVDAAPDIVRIMRDENSSRGSHHRHLLAGRWDKDGSECEWCKAWHTFAAAVDALLAKEADHG